MSEEEKEEEKTDWQKKWDAFVQQCAIMKANTIKSYLPPDLTLEEQREYAKEHIRLLTPQDDFKSEILVIDDEPVGVFKIEIGESIKYNWIPIEEQPDAQDE